jgi:hypothetical protein
VRKGDVTGDRLFAFLPDSFLFRLEWIVEHKTPGMQVAAIAGSVMPAQLGERCACSAGLIGHDPQLENSYAAWFDSVITVAPKKPGRFLRPAFL